jgi:dihydropyrimidine dehydrogenase (NAD+) subunit PreA
MADISTSLAGVRMRSPFGISPHNLDKLWFPGKKAADLFMKYVDAGAGFVYVPAIVPGEPTQAEKDLDFPALVKNQQYVGRWIKIQENRRMFGHLYTARSLFNFYPWAAELVETLKPRLPKDVPIIGQVLVHDLDPQAWAAQVLRVQGLGVDIIELNTGCPVGAMSRVDATKLPPEAKWGMMMGVSPEVLFPVLEAVVSVATVPVGFKLTPESGYPRMLHIVEGAAQRGVKYVVTTHKYFAVAPPDIYNEGRGRWPALGGYNPLCDMGGATLRFSMYKATALISKNIPNIDCFAGGGITAPEHVAEAVMLGAPAAQTLTGMVQNGIPFLTKTNQWLSHYMDRQGFKSIQEFRGMGLPWIKGAMDVEFQYHVARPNLDKCHGCGSCAETYCPAITMQGKTPVVDARYCSCCGMCQVACPRNAYEFVPR